MECNKDEAMRAKDIAERKFAERDFAGAKKFALKAQTLYPGLENISQMLSTIEVYLSAENRINGEMDMYGILGVNPVADDDTIKKHYKKLVLTLHPDKNKSIGADGAFQLVQEAYNFLSDKVKRSAYNSRVHVRMAQQKVPPQSGVSMGPTGSRQFEQKFPTQGGVSFVPPRTGKKVDQKVPQGGAAGASKPGGQSYKSQGSSASQQKVPTQSGVSSTVPPGVNGYHKHPGSSSSRGKLQKSSTQKASTAAQAFFKKGDTFWTVCTRCKMQYEYMRVYLNQILKCPHCQEGFMAVEIPPPSNLSPIRPQQQPVKSCWSSGPHVSGFNNSVGGASARWSPMSGTTAYSSTPSSAFVSGSTTSPSQMMNDRGKREREEAQATTRWERKNDSGFVDESSKKRREDKGSTPSETGVGNRETGIGTAYGLMKENSEAGRVHFSQGISSKFYLHRELSQVELRKMLTDKALMVIRNKLSQCSEVGVAVKEKAKVKGKDRQKQKLTKNTAMQELEGNTQKGSNSNKSSLATPDADMEQEAVQMTIMSVPDPDFHVFDLDRSESCFGENQVWAAYDDDDGMPRFYGMIHEVISLDPFEVKMSWLNSKSNSEFSPVDWIGRGFIKTCGEFRVGKHVTNNSLNSFSHKVKWVKGPRGVIQIYPKKGEIWALYRNWSPDWNEDTPDKIKHAYDMVEVLDDYTEEEGVSVATLCKAAGFKTVFYKQPEPKEVKHILKEEMFRFSHQVPSHILTGEEKPNAPKGYVELDPAATPPDLLQVIASANKEKATEGSKVDHLVARP